MVEYQYSDVMHAGTEQHVDTLICTQTSGGPDLKHQI